MIKVGPSLMCADLLRLGEQIRSVETGGADWLHLDIMDGHFVPGFTFGADVVRQVTRFSTLPIEVHLMSDRPIEHMDEFLEAGIDLLTVHAEATADLYRCIATIKRKGVRAGVAVNPVTPLGVLSEVLPVLDCVLIMAVSPGFVGQSQISSSLAKAAALVCQLRERDLSGIEVVVDGGVKVDNVAMVATLGVHGVVSGTGIFGCLDPGAAVRDMKARVVQGTMM